MVFIVGLGEAMYRLYVYSLYFVAAVTSLPSVRVLPSRVGRFRARYS